MKKFVNKFFGIDGQSGAPRVASWYTPHRSNCGWDILCQFVRGLLFVGNEATIALMVLKLIGSITIGWSIVVLPAVIRAVFEVIEIVANNKISKINSQLREAYYAECIKRDFIDGRKPDEGNGFDVDEAELYDLK